MQAGILHPVKTEEQECYSINFLKCLLNICVKSSARVAQINRKVAIKRMDNHPTYFYSCTSICIITHILINIFFLTLKMIFWYN